MICKMYIQTHLHHHHPDIFFSESNQIKSNPETNEQIDHSKNKKKQTQVLNVWSSIYIYIFCLFLICFSKNDDMYLYIYELNECPMDIVPIQCVYRDP